MDDENINRICLDVEEVQLDGEEKDWIKLSWISSQSDDDENFQLSEDSNNETVRMKDCDNEVSINTESEDISDGISVITESDMDNTNVNRHTNLFQICPSKPFKYPERLEVQVNRQKDGWNILIACVFGITIGLVLSQFFTIPRICPVSSTVDTESLKSASHNIVSTCKELTNVKTLLNELKAHIPTDKQITKQFLAQFFEITDSSNKTSSKVTKEFFNSAPHPLDQLQGSLHVLSLLASSYGDNSFLKNEISKTLDIVNNTKVFYDTLILLTNNTQNEFNPIVLNFLQHDIDKMHITSKSLFSKLIEKMSKIISKMYNKYAKERYRLNKKFCHLTSILPDDKFLKQLTKSNQLFKDYDKSCFSNYISKKSNGKTIAKENTRIKEQIIRTDDTILHSKDDISKNNFDDVLMQLKNACPLSTNYCPKFDINTSTLDTLSNRKTKNDKKRTNKKETMDHENSANILLAEGESRPKKKDYFKSNGSTKKVVNDKVNYEGKDTSSQNKIKNHISEHTDNYHKFDSSPDSRTMKQNNQHCTNTDRKSERYEYKKQWQLGDSDWYFRRVYSRRNARKHTQR